MRSSSDAPRAKILRGATVQPFQLSVAPEERRRDAPAAPEWDGRDRRAPSVPEKWDGRERRSGQELVSAREEFFKEGYEAGRRDAERESGTARADLERARAALLLARVQLDAQRAEALAVAEDEIAALAFSVAESVLQRELELAAEPGREAVARALALVPAEADVIVRLHPDDASQVGPIADESRRVVIVADPAIERGGCIADAGACRIDTQVGTALARVRSILCTGEGA